MGKLILEGEFGVVLGFPHIRELLNNLLLLSFEGVVGTFESREELVEDSGVVEVIVGPVDVVVHEGEQIEEQLLALVYYLQKVVEGV